jgi:hypothetical protein
MMGHTCVDNGLHTPCEACEIEGGIQSKSTFNYNERHAKELAAHDENRTEHQTKEQEVAQ